MGLSVVLFFLFFCFFCIADPDLGISDVGKTPLEDPFAPFFPSSGVCLSYAMACFA